MIERDNELDELLKDAQGYIVDAKDLTGELDLEALMRELDMTENSENAFPASVEEKETSAPGQADESIFDSSAETDKETLSVEETPVPAVSGQESNIRSVLLDDTVLLDTDTSSKKNETAAPADDSAPTVKIEIPDEAETDEKHKLSLKERRALRKEEKKSESDSKKKENEDELPGYATLIHDVAFLLVFVCLFFTFVVRIIGVKGSSMVPTLSEGDRVLVLSDFLVKDYEYGDIVVCISDTYKAPQRIPLVKRVIATEGQTVDIDFKTGTVTVDGKKITETYINDKTNYNPGGFNYPITVEDGCVFVMGDNRNRSTDSRDGQVGFIHVDNIIGRVFYRIAPFKVFGKVR